MTELQHDGAQSDELKRERWQAFKRAQVDRLAWKVLEEDFDPDVVARLQRVRSIR